MIAGSEDKKVYVAAAPGKHHHSLVVEVDKEESKVYTTENGKTVEISNLQLSGTYHLEVEVNKGTTIADGTSTGGDAVPTPVGGAPTGGGGAPTGGGGAS